MKSRFDQYVENFLKESNIDVWDDKAVAAQLEKMSKGLQEMANDAKTGKLNPANIRDFSISLIDIADGYEAYESNKD